LLEDVGYFFRPASKRVSLMKIVRAHGFKIIVAVAL
jgi:hypothetical protein